MQGLGVRAAFLLILLLGAALRIGMLGRDVRFHPDEALYATYARRMSYYGDLLFRDVPLDKPPLGLVITALSFSAGGDRPSSRRACPPFSPACCRWPPWPRSPADSSAHRSRCWRRCSTPYRPSTWPLPLRPSTTHR